MHAATRSRAVSCHPAPATPTEPARPWSTTAAPAQTAPTAPRDDGLESARSTGSPDAGQRTTSGSRHHDTSRAQAFATSRPRWRSRRQAASPSTAGHTADNHAPHRTRRSPTNPTRPQPDPTRNAQDHPAEPTPPAPATSTAPGRGHSHETPWTAPPTQSRPRKPRSARPQRACPATPSSPPSPSDPPPLDCRAIVPHGPDAQTVTDPRS